MFVSEWENSHFGGSTTLGAQAYIPHDPQKPATFQPLIAELLCGEQIYDDISQTSPAVEYSVASGDADREGLSLMVTRIVSPSVRILLPSDSFQESGERDPWDWRMTLARVLALAHGAGLFAGLGRLVSRQLVAFDATSRFNTAMHQRRPRVTQLG